MISFFRSIHCRKVYGWVFLMGLIGVLFGCAAYAPYTPAEDKVAYEDYPNVTIDPSLRGSIVQSGVTSIPADSAYPLRVRLTLRSVVDLPLSIEYRVVYFDETGKKLTKYPVWKVLRFEPRAQQVISSNAISMSATRWSVELREYQ